MHLSFAQYQSNWEDSDGSWTNRVSSSDTSTVMGPARAGHWWNLDFRPGKCEIRDGWKFPQQLCDKDDRYLASMFTVVMPQNNQQGSAVLGMIDPNANARMTRAGSMTHFGLTGDGSLNACTPPETCGETTSRSWVSSLIIKIPTLCMPLKSHILKTHLPKLAILRHSRILT